ncbi:MAG: MerR family transcriptional regulator [Thermoanaerobaculia bacterium]|nr:MerR family transcriptional regulator [Thermoanaerobaculia bacterium]
MNGFLTIGEVAQSCGLKPSAIRFYESEELLAPARRQSGRRLYSEDVYDRLALIRLAREAGFRIAEIRMLIRDFPAEAPARECWSALVAGKRREIGDKLRELTRMNELLEMLEDCRCPDLETCGRVASSRRARMRR